MKRVLKVTGCLFLMCLLGTTSVHSQENIRTVNEIETLISQDSLVKAKAAVSKNIALYTKQKQYDSLVDYIQFEGSFKLNKGDTQAAITKAGKLTDFITATNDPHLIRMALTNLSYIYDYAGQTDKAYEVMLEAVEPTSRITKPKNTDAASVQYSLGFYKTKTGDYPQSKKHFFKSLALLKKSKADDYVFYNQIYTSLGGILWQQTKPDSAHYYFNEALEALKKTDSTDLKNKLFRPSLIKLNMSILLNGMGKNKDAIAISYEAIEALQQFIENTTDEFYIKQSKRFIFSLLDNLASYHNTLGEYKRSEEIIEYTFARKQTEFTENDIDIIISHIVLAQAKTANRNFEGAAYHADKALELFENKTDGDTFWKAAALSIRGTIYEQMGNMEMAKEFYEKGDKAYRASSGSDYSKDFLDHFIQLSKFYVTINDEQKAIATAKEAYDFAHKGALKNTLQEFHQIQNLATVYFQLKNYENALKYSDEAIRFNLLADGNKLSGTDSILVQYRKPIAIFTNTASQYYLSQNKTPELLKQFLKEIDHALAILDKRKKVVNNHQDVTILISENEELFNFAKKLRLELYELTKDEVYLDEVVSLHESAIYNRIRSRLNLRENVAFKNVPKVVLEKETRLKNSMTTTLQNTGEGIETYISASEKWEAFIETLQKDYPEYYKMRYETLEEPIKDLQGKIPENTTVVRYLFIEDKLYAFVVSHSAKKMIPLDHIIVEGHIKEVSEVDFSVEKKSPLLYELYTVLWKPLEESIKTKKVVIIPDRELFNLSFEMLTPKPIQDFKEFITNSLLANYDISYNFSLLLYKDKRKVITYPKNYVGFVPGFSKEMKQEYQIGLRDCVNTDNAYLTLLPQPFSEKLVKEYAKVFDGNYFLNENASKPLFINNAKEHKIIHIGTHAESNNISPELSRLVFAKKVGRNKAYDENSLYAYEIYDIDLSSNLAILTACETGKPTYQAGEGAISLAHAFNYAGSESILTSLWDIDEVSSAQIVGYFYDFLAKGLPKDEALKKAKLQYLSTAEGRAAAPQYWAGLVLIGDTAPIQFQQASNPIWWWIVGLLLVIGLALYLVRRKKSIKS
ncbi:MAG: CHAT domain-containing tetratricopeptide repeat protein [Lentimicrobium sp.]|jgi:CHAT domain-containing protein|nr:CHAT domain-containing tetratricopeptide repeat protein [Lentimicrobium sp.]